MITSPDDDDFKNHSNQAILRNPNSCKKKVNLQITITTWRRCGLVMQDFPESVNWWNHTRRKAGLLVSQ